MPRSDRYPSAKRPDRGSGNPAARRRRRTGGAVASDGALSVQPWLQLRLKKIPDGEIDAVERGGMSKNSDHAGAGRARRFDSDRRILEHDAVSGCDTQFLRGSEIHVGSRLRPGHLRAIDDRAETSPEVRAVQHEIDVRRLGVGRQPNRSGTGSLQQVGHSGHQVTIQLIAHHLAKQPFLGRAVLEHDLRIDIFSEEIADDLVVPPAMHAGFYVVPLYPQRVQITLPSQRVERHRIDDDAIQIEDESQTLFQGKAQYGLRVLRYGHCAEYNTKSGCNIKVRANNALG